MEGGAFQSKRLAKQSRDCVFTFLHQTRPDSRESYRLVAREFLEEEFLHPVYFFLRPDGTEVDERNRHHHEALSAARIESILEGIRKEWGPGLSEEAYEAARASLVEAEGLLRSGEAERAGRILAKLSGLKARCGVRDRAVAMRREIAARRALLDSLASAKGLDARLSGRLAEAIRAGDLVSAFRRLRREGGPSPAARDLTGELARTLGEMIRLKPPRLDKVYLGTGTYYTLRAEWETDLPRFDGLGMQISYLVEGGRTYEAWAVFDGVEPHPHHRAAVSVTSRDLRLREPVNGRVQLWLDDFLLGESLLAKEPAEFPADSSQVKVGPGLLRPDETLGASTHERVVKSGVGRYPGAE